MNQTPETPAPDSDSGLKDPSAGATLNGQNERIVAAAIVQDGVVFTGTRHSFIIRDIVIMTGARRVDGKQGFVTSTGRFVDRFEAGVLARVTGQVKELRYNKNQLFSEELWDIPSVGAATDSEKVLEVKEADVNAMHVPRSQEFEGTRSLI